MTGEEARELAEWGAAGRKYVARRAEAGTVEGVAYATRLTSLPPAEAAGEVRAMFAVDATRDLADDIAGDLGIAPEIAAAIAEELAAGRKRLARATRPFSRPGEPADNGAS